jgi:hypothetical protein
MNCTGQPIASKKYAGNARDPLKKITLLFTALLTVSALSSQSQAQTVQTGQASKPPERSRTFFPHNWVRGYTDFSVAPSHNEPDLGRCAYPLPASAGGAASLCTAYARYLFSGYVELQPFGRTPARHLFFFFEPKFSFGSNVPQLNYTASMAPIAYERAIGIGFQLPKNFEVRATQHQVDWLGRYSKPLGPADLGTNGPYGLYATFGVRWTFGGYGHQGAPSAY